MFNYHQFKEHLNKIKTELDSAYSARSTDFFVSGDLNDKWGRKNRIRIEGGQPINTSVFEEAIVLEWDGVLTKEGFKHYSGVRVAEGEMKPTVNVSFL